MTRTASLLGLAGVFTLAGAACRHFQVEPRPLYEGQARPASEVARLSGPVGKVDGVKVSRLGTLFALLPGCHVVELPSTLGEGSSSGAWSVDIGHVEYAFVMKPGYLYAIEIKTQPGNAASTGNADVGGVAITAVERDAGGKLLAKIPQVRTKADLEKCQATEVQP